MKVSYVIFFGFVFTVSLLIPVSVHAAGIYFAPVSGSYAVGEQFSIDVFASSPAQEMNAAKATIESSNSNLQVVSVNQSGSIIDFWAQEPQITGSGGVNFEGVMLGGGYSGSAGKLATLVVRARSVGEAVITATSGSILANDGLGTELATDLGTARFSIRAPEESEPEAALEGLLFVSNLNQGDSGDEVTRLQTCLLDQGFYTGDINGSFGAQTRQAVIDFQEHYRDDVLAPGGFLRGTGLVGEATRKKLNEVCFVPLQLFDITVRLESTSVTKARDLKAVVAFESFGRVPTPADLTFRILDETGREILLDEDKITVETEAIFIKEFKYLYLPVGKYKLELITLYNTDVEDKFFVEFEVTKSEGSLFTEFGFWVGATAFLMLAVIILLLVIIGLLLRRTPEYRKRQDKRMLKKEEAALRRAHKYLLMTKIKTEQEMQKIENKLKRFTKKDDSS